MNYQKNKNYIWFAAIIALVGLSSYIVFGTHHDKAANKSVLNNPAHFALDIKGGVRATLEAQVDKLPPGTKYDGNIVMQVIQKRIQGVGVGEQMVQRKGDRDFVVELPDVKNKDAVLQMLGTTAQLNFYYFQNVSTETQTRQYKMYSPGEKDTPGGPVDYYIFVNNTNHQVFRDGSHIRGALTGVLAQVSLPGSTPYTVASPLADPAITVNLTSAQQDTVKNLGIEMQEWKAFIASNSPTIMTGDDLLPQSAVEFAPNSVSPEITQVFNGPGTKKMADFSSAHVNEFMGIVLDDAILSAPVIQSAITEGRGEITGSFTMKEANDLANLLNAGSLPVPMKQVETLSVDATLGSGAVLRQTVIAGVAGLLLVLLFMLWFYRLPGLLADIALIFYTIFTFAIYVKGFPLLNIPSITLSLPGIAGFILSIGMAVDANILIFERVKEELRGGKSLRPAIDSGFRRAFSAIRDSNICTIITCLVLLSMGSPTVSGFALTLLVGVLISLFSAILVTRTLLYLTLDMGFGSNLSLYGIDPKIIGDANAGVPRLNIIGKRYRFYALSLAIIVPGLLFLAMGGLKPSIECSAATSFTVQFGKATTQDDVKAAVAAAGFKDALVQMAEGGTYAIISTKKTSDLAETDPQNVVKTGLVSAVNSLVEQKGLGGWTQKSYGKVAPQISSEITRNAIQAVCLASGLIVLYLAFVFAIGGFVSGLRFGTSAIVALLHDVLVLLGSFAIFGYFLNWEIDPMFVTAMLTVIGFSVHDTVVIFDRVRENLHHRVRGESFEELVNRSVNQTLARSVRTSMTVLLTLLSLIIFGGHNIKLLNVALFIGILSGTYSSICNAASVMVDWENWLAKRRGATVGKPITASANGSSGVRVMPNSGPRALPTRPANSGIPSDTSATPNAGPGITASRVKRKKPARRF